MLSLCFRYNNSMSSRRCQADVNHVLMVNTSFPLISKKMYTLESGHTGKFRSLNSYIRQRFSSSLIAFQTNTWTFLDLFIQGLNLERIFHFISKFILSSFSFHIKTERVFKRVIMLPKTQKMGVIFQFKFTFHSSDITFDIYSIVVVVR